MAFVIKLSFHKRLFLQLLAFSWSIVLCFIVFQYFREKDYKSESLNLQLQHYNRRLLEVVENGEDYENYLLLHEKPFDDLRITLITLSGSVFYDNLLIADSLENHNNRPEVIKALGQGAGYHIGRQSASDGIEYFYSASKGERVIVRTAIPYTNSLREMLKTDWYFIFSMLLITLSMSILAYFTTRRLGKDIERVNRYEADRERNLLKRQLTNNINHELKTPVASIQACLETLLSGIKLNADKQRDLLERCYMQCERLRRLLNDVSLITRLEDGSERIAREPVFVNKIIDEIAKEMEWLPEKERLNLHINVSDEIIINGNLSLIISVFRNLTENAIAYSEGQNIYISLLANDEKECRISFEDDGKGVPDEHLPHLFERFYRVDKGRSRQKGGTGLGLAIVKHAVQFHGGSISVQNRLGGGLRFEFSIEKGGGGLPFS